VGSVEGGCFRLGGDHRREGAVLGVNVEHPIVANGDCGVVILCLEGWRRGSSKITFGFLFVKGEGLLKVTGSHVHWKSDISETVLD